MNPKGMGDRHEADENRDRLCARINAAVETPAEMRRRPSAFTLLRGDLLLLRRGARACLLPRDAALLGVDERHLPVPRRDAARRDPV